jgi:hypothetical protein
LDGPINSAVSPHRFPRFKFLMTTPYISQVERLYRELATPKPADVKPAPVAGAGVKPITRDDVTAIITRRRSATADELQTIIDRANDFALTDGERDQIGLALSICVAQRVRGQYGRREHPSDRLIHDLGYAQTPFGLLYDRASFQRQMQSGSKSIAECRRHVPPHCSCWRDVRESLWFIRSSFPERSAEAFAAMQVWESLEDLELSSRPERRETLN